MMSWGPGPARFRTGRRLAALDGAELELGCQFCDGVSVVKPVGSGVWALVDQHQDDCPAASGRLEVNDRG